MLYNVLCSKMTVQAINLSITSRTNLKPFFVSSIDHIGKLCSKQFAPYLYVQHIMYETNKYYIPQQNGFIEHDDQTITKVAHNMLYAKSLPLCMLSTLPYIFSINLIQLVMAWDQAYCLTLLSLWLFCLHVH
jgi:hypothetical protein